MIKRVLLHVAFKLWNKLKVAESLKNCNVTSPLGISCSVKNSLNTDVNSDVNDGIAVEYCYTEPLN